MLCTLRTELLEEVTLNFDLLMVFTLGIRNLNSDGSGFSGPDALVQIIVVGDKNFRNSLFDGNLIVTVYRYRTFFIAEIELQVAILYVVIVGEKGFLVCQWCII